MRLEVILFKIIQRTAAISPKLYWYQYVAPTQGNADENLHFLRRRSHVMQTGLGLRGQCFLHRHMRFQN